MNWKQCLPRPDCSERLKPSRAELRALDAENKRFPVDRLCEIPQNEWPINSPPRLIRALRNRDFMVQVYAEADDVLRLSIHRTAFDRTKGRWAEGISWDDLQHLKTLAGYGDRTAVELFPPTTDVVNVANMRHLWILPSPPDFMWSGKARGLAA